MVTVCAWCQKYMGSREPFHNHELSHGICDDCRERENCLPGGVLIVVSRERAADAPLLRTLLRGVPGAAIVVDRRRGERRQRRDGPAPEAGDRRSGDRRHASSLFLV